MFTKACNRYRASVIHLYISIAVFLLFTFVLLKLWYPAPFFSASGGWQGLKIVALFDLVLGPLLTFVVFNNKKSKRELRTDISLIVLLQFAALIWGIYTVYNQRPVAAAFWEGRFYTVPASALERQNFSLEKLKELSDQRPAYIYVVRPDTAEKWQPVLEKMKENNIPPHHQVELYRPVGQYLAEIYTHSLGIEEIVTKNKEMKEQIETILKDSNTTLGENHYIALESKYRNIILVYNTDNRLIGTANTPYKKE